MKSLSTIFLWAVICFSVKSEVHEINFLFYNNQHILIEAQSFREHNGYFLFDTGGKNVLNSYKFSEFHKKKRVTIESIDLGNWKTNKQGFVMDDYYRRFSAADEVYQNLLGMLGPEIFEGKVFQINYKAGKIIVADDISEIPANLLTNEIPVTIKKHLTNKISRFSTVFGISLRLETKEMNELYLSLDTGSGGDVTHYTGFLQRGIKKFGHTHLQIDTLEVNSINPYTFSPKAKPAAYKVILHGAKAGDFEYDALPVVFKSNGPNVIGNGFLKNYIVTIDWNSRKMYLHEGLELDESISQNSPKTPF